jgi:hypothetical protein
METTPIRFQPAMRTPWVCLAHHLPPDYEHPVLFVDTVTVTRPEHPILVIDLGEELAAPFVRCRRRFRASKTIFQSRTWAFLNLLPLVTGMGYSEIFRGLSLKRWYESSNPN